MFGYLRGLWTKICEISASSLLTYILFCVFGVGSWLAINGIWAEQSVLVVSLPECYDLPVILAVVTQIANIGPIFYTVIKCILSRCSVRVLHIEIVAVYVLLGIGLVACILLSLMWNKTLYVLGAHHSVGLILLTFFLALVDCTSTLVFIPFMKHFPAIFISALYIGEGMSGIVPSIVALSQGFVNDSIDCTRRYVGVETLGINFSPNVYFIFLAFLTIVCGLAFTAIITLPAVRQQMIPTSISLTMHEGSPSYSQTDSASSKLIEDSRLSEEEVTESRETRERCLDTPDDDTAGIVGSPLLQSDRNHITEKVYISRHLRQHSNVRNYFISDTYVGRLLAIVWNNLLLFVCMFILNFVSNGTVPSISAFIFKPYGNTVYNLAINLGILAFPLSTLLYVFISHKSKSVIALLTSIVSLLGIYLLVVAIQPILKDHITGKIIVVSCLCDIIYTCSTHLS